MPNLISRILCAVFPLFFFHTAYSQDFIYRHYDVQDGLPSSTIHSIFQDKEGFLWFGTESGLCRYDGSRFKTFTAKDGLSDNEVFGMIQDSKGRMWLMQYENSVTYIYNGKVYNRENDSLLKKIVLETRLHGVAEDGEGNIALCDTKTLYIISKEGAIIKTIHTIDGNSLDAVKLYIDSDGKMVIGALRSLYKLEDLQLKFMRRLSPDSLGVGPNDVLLHPNYRIVGYFDTLYLKDTAVYFKLPERIFKYSSLSDSVFSINTANGAFLVNTRNQNSTYIIPGKRVTNTFIDREKNLWIGTQGQGIYKMGSPLIINKKIGDNEDDIYFITKENDKILVANNNGKIFEYDGDTFIKKDIAGSRDWDRRSVFYYEKLNGQKYFLAHSNGLLTYGDGTFANRRQMIMLKHVLPVDGSHVLASSHNGIELVRKKDLRTIDTIWKRKSMCLFLTNDSLLAGTISGLYILKKGKGGYTIVDSLLQSSIIRFVKRSANNLVWIGTFAEGLYCMKNGKIFRHFTDSLDLPGNDCKSVFIQGNDIWLGTSKGLVRITCRGERFESRIYSMSDGLPSNIINCIYVQGKTVYIGTPAGLCYFDESIIETTSMCNLVLTGIRIADKPVELSGNYSLKRNQRFVIEYSGISFRSEQDMIYRYRIGGLDDNWQTTNLNSLEFTSLPYGDYKLEMVAINKFGKESLPLELHLHIERPFHKTTWFIAILVLLPVLMLLSYLHWSKRRQMQKLQQEMKVVELEQMALRAQMNPHFIFNCISAIQQLITEKDTDNANRFVASFSDLIRLTLDNAPDLFIPLNEEIKFLSSYLELERIRLEELFSYSIQTANDHHPGEWLVPNMVIQPFVENAIRHGVRYKKNGQGFIEVKFEERDNSLRCTVTDNGIGREKAEQIKKELGVYHTSKGMGITFQRIQFLNTISDGKIYVTIEDLKDADHIPSGTKVIIDFYKLQHHDKGSNNR